jgi:hypothetical protein
MKQRSEKKPAKSAKKRSPKKRAPDERCTKVTALVSAAANPAA